MPSLMAHAHAVSANSRRLSSTPRPEPRLSPDSGPPGRAEPRRQSHEGVNVNANGRLHGRDADVRERRMGQVHVQRP